MLTPGYCAADDCDDWAPLTATNRIQRVHTTRWGGSVEMCAEEYADAPGQLVYRVDVDDSVEGKLTPRDARELAQRLIRAAELVEQPTAAQVQS